MSNTKSKPADQFKAGDWVAFDKYECLVVTKKGKKCLAIAMPLGWYHFEPENWNDVKPYTDRKQSNIKERYFWPGF